MNKASGGDGILPQLFQILKDDAVKVLHSICQQIWKTQQWLHDWKRSISISIPKKGNAKEYSNCHRIALFSHASKIMLKILQVRIQQYMKRELPDVQAGFRKSREPEIKLPTFVGSCRKQGSSRKTSTSVSFTMLKPLTVWIPTNCGKFLKRPEYQTIFSVSWETPMWFTKQQNHIWSNWLVQNWARNATKLYHHAYLTYMQTISHEIPGWMDHKLESRLPGEISTTSNVQKISL